VLLEKSKGAVPMARSILIEKFSSGHREGANTSKKIHHPLGIRQRLLFRGQ